MDGVGQRETVPLRRGADALAEFSVPVGTQAEERYTAQLRQRLSHELEPLAFDLRSGCDDDAGDVAARPREARHEPGLHGVAVDRSHDWHCLGNLFGDQRHVVADGNDGIDRLRDKFADDLSEALEPAVGRPTLKYQVPSFLITERTQFVDKRPGGRMFRIVSLHLRNR